MAGKDVVFIDANIYLDFFQSNGREFKRLIDSLLEIKSKIFFTEQIRDEIERNKLGVFLKSAKIYSNQAKVNKVFLPIHLDGVKEDDIQNWNSDREELTERIHRSNKRLTELIHSTAQNIMKSEDPISKKLDSLYEQSIKTSDFILEAEERKDLGNPPGKNNDPIGDQLHWIGLLDYLNEDDRVWIISKDKDYYYKLDKELFINPYLLNELVDIGVSDVICFDSLAAGLSSINGAEPISSLPSKEDLDKIIEEEQEINQLNSGSVDFPVSGSMQFGLTYLSEVKPNKCPRCGHPSSFQYIESGGYICGNCGANIHIVS